MSNNGVVMNRREFTLGAASAAFSFSAMAQENGEVSVQISPGVYQGPLVPSDFIGLSYEMGQLYNPRFFSRENKPIIEAFRALNSNGVLRLGGHLSNITPWEGVGRDDPKQIAGVRHGIEDYWEWPLVDPVVQRNKRGMLTRQAIENLRGFLDAVDWRLIYGLNFACGSAARAADEAAAVSQIMEGRLIAFVVGNEPDGFGEDRYFRAPGYGFEQYIGEYESWVKTIRARVPGAKFAGPDTDGKVDTWVIPFAKRAGRDVALLTSHYYGMGPASDPGMTAERLLQKVNPELDAQIKAVNAARTAAGGTPYRMDECNSCFGGGRPGVSDAYASAVWAADYILRIACAGFAGVNLHGGGVGVYTPIASSATAPAAPRPVYYGMQFAQKFVGWHVSPCTLETNANVTAYQGSKPEKTILAFVNKGGSHVRVALPDRFAKESHVQRWELRGPSLAAKTGVQLGPAVHKQQGRSTRIDSYSAVILLVE
jgi:hypothetical protein